MADSFSWFKLWFVAITDQELDNLPLEDFARWAKLGAYIKAHGTSGNILITEPATTLCSILKVPDFVTLGAMLHRISGLEIKVENCNAIGKSYISVTFRNWHKWQGDNSRERVRRWRSKCNVAEERRGERELRGRAKRAVTPPSFQKSGDVSSVSEIIEQNPFLKK